MEDWDKLDEEFGVAPGTSTAAEEPNWDDLDKTTQRRLLAPPARFKQEPEPVKAAPVEDFAGGTIRIGPVDTGIPLPASVNKGLAQIGSGFADVGLAYNQMFAGATKEDAAAKRALDAPLNKGIAGTVNNFVGNVAPFLAVPAGAMPRTLGAAGPLIEGIGVGATQGALQPVAPGESRGLNMAIGSGAGAVIPGIMAMGQRAAKAPSSMKPLVDAAQAEGIPLSMADTTSNKFVKALRSIGDDLFITSSGNAAVKESQQEAFNKAVGSRWGSSNTKHTLESIAEDRQRIGQELQKVYQNDIPYDANMFGTMRKMEQLAKDNPDAAATIHANIRKVEDSVVSLPNGDLVIPGKTAQNIQSEWAKLYGKSNDATSNSMKQFRQEYLDTINSGLTGEQAAKHNLARKQYKAVKELEKEVAKAAAGTAQRQTGDISPIGLSQAVVNGYGGGPSPFGMLPQVGQQFLRDTTKQTGGSPRAMLQNAGLGALLTGSGWLGTPALSGALALGTYGANKVVSSPGIRRALLESGQPAAMPTTARAIAAQAAAGMLGNTVRRAPPVGALGVMSAYPSIEVRGHNRDGGTENDE